MARTVAVVAHTHWDREWYLPFAAFRVRLLDSLDGLLDGLEARPSAGPFLLDGQVAAVDDYLALRPEATDRLAALVTDGRVSIGPWYVLMDEFLVSAETIIRNLQRGLRTAESLGGAMAVGYLPDTFGHIAQMPQILRQAGFEHAVVWRGVPAAVDRTGFWWDAPDGSRVRAEWLPVGYANGAALPEDPGALLRRVHAHDAETESYRLGPEAPMLLLCGGDQQLPPPWLAAVVGGANRIQSSYHFEISSLPGYLSGAPTAGLRAWSGELRSSARANLLPGVLSTRLDVKQAAARAERSLEREAEPLCALWLPPDDQPEAILDAAWLQVIRNAAHDSVCACSADEVVTTVLHRYGEAIAAAQALSAGAARAAGAAMAAEGPVVLNPSHRSRGGLIEMTVAGERPPPDTQVLRSVAAAVVRRQGTGGDLAAVLGSLTAEGWLPEQGSREVIMNPTPACLEVVIRTQPAEGPRLRRGAAAGGSAMAELWAQAGAARHRPLSVQVERPATQQVLARVIDVPGYGWRRCEPVRPDIPVQVPAAGVLDNGLVRVEVDPSDGTFAIVDRVAGRSSRGLGRLVDGGDEGDTYNYSPPAVDMVVDRPGQVRVLPGAQGPLRATVVIEADFCWPEAIRAGRREGQRRVTVMTELELRAGERLLRGVVSFDNPCRDHRLRCVFPLPDRASGSRAECAFAIVDRPLSAEGGRHEAGLPTFPSRRFVSAGGLLVTHEGLPEYEVVDDGRSIAVTILRSVGMLSRPAPALRPNAAGPTLELEAAQRIAPVTARWAVTLDDTDPYHTVDDAWLPLVVTEGTGDGRLGASGSHLEVAGAEVSCLRRVAGELELRVFNPTPMTASVQLPGRVGRLVDLRGGTLERFAGGFELGPWKIATALLDG